MAFEQLQHLLFLFCGRCFVPELFPPVVTECGLIARRHSLAKLYKSAFIRRFSPSLTPHLLNPSPPLPILSTFLAMAAAPTTAFIYIACLGSSHHTGGFHPSIVISPTTLTSGRNKVCSFQIVGTASGWALAYQGPVFLDTDVQLLGLISLGETVVPANSFLEFFAAVPAVPSGVHGESELFVSA